MEVLHSISKKLGVLQKIIAIAAPIAAIAVAFVWYKNNIWEPEVKLISVDWKKGIANFLVGKKAKTVYAGSVTAAGGGWGIRFSANDPYESGNWNRLELSKDDLVRKIIVINTTPQTP